MPNWLLALVTGAAALLLSLAWIWLLQRPRNETRDGLRALASLSWREFSGAVLASLQRRGFAELPDPSAPSGPEAQPGRLLSYGKERWLLVCKHGSAYRVGAAAVTELAEDMRLRNADGAFLATQGQVDADGLRIAGGHKIEVLTGAPLWQATKPNLPAVLRDGVVGKVRNQARRHSAIAALASVALAALTAVVTPAADEGGSQRNRAPAPARHAIAASAQAPSAAVEAPVETDETVLQQQRDAVSRALSPAQGITRGYWISKLTLVIDRSGDDEAVWPQVCRELERYPALRASRVQINPRPGTGEQVRWRQCRTF